MKLNMDAHYLPEAPLLFVQGVGKEISSHIVTTLSQNNGFYPRLPWKDDETQQCPCCTQEKEQEHPIVDEEGIPITTSIKKPNHGLNEGFPSPRIAIKGPQSDMRPVITVVTGLHKIRNFLRLTPSLKNFYIKSNSARTPSY